MEAPLESPTILELTVPQQACKFSLKGLKLKGRVVEVYDGDTVTIIMKPHEEYYSWTCRLSGIDTPEIVTKNESEKLLAIAARDFLRERILNKIVDVHCSSFDKYGRVLVAIYSDDEDISQVMLDSGHARPYGASIRDVRESMANRAFQES